MSETDQCRECNSEIEAGKVVCSDCWGDELTPSQRLTIMESEDNNV